MIFENNTNFLLSYDSIEKKLTSRKEEKKNYEIQTKLHDGLL